MEQIWFDYLRKSFNNLEVEKLFTKFISCITAIGLNRRATTAPLTRRAGVGEEQVRRQGREFCADLVWNGEFVLDVTIVRIFTLTLSPEYQVIMEKLQHRVARPEKNLCNRVKAILTPLNWFVNVVIVGSMAYGTALQGTSDLDLQVNCYFELSTIEFQLVPP